MLNDVVGAWSRLADVNLGDRMLYHVGQADGPLIPSTPTIPNPRSILRVEHDLEANPHLDDVTHALQLSVTNC